MADINLATASFPVEYGVGQQKLSTVRDIRGSSKKVKSGSTTRNATGSFSVTGVGFRPSMICLTSSNGGSICIGYGTASSQSLVEIRGSTSNTSTINIVYLENGGGITHTASLSSLDADGFTLNFSACTISCDINYQCWA